MSQVIAMARRLQEAEQTIADLRKALEVKAPHHAHVNGTVNMEGSDGSLGRRHTAQLVMRSPPREPTSEELLSDLSLDGNGKVRRQDAYALHLR